MKSPVERLIGRFIMAPAWINVALGITSYVLIEWYRRTHVPLGANPILAISSSIYAPVALAAFLLTALAGAIHKARRAGNLEQQTGLESLRSMPWKDFELLVAEIYQRQGYAVQYSLDNGPDGGVDLILKRDGAISIVQCKCWRTQSVGVKTAREMFGLLHHHNGSDAIIVTTGSFTDQAVQFAKGKPIRLLDGVAVWNLVSALKSTTGENAESTRVGLSTEQECPACGKKMLVKTARRGPRKGTQFWGCSNYPDCRSTLPI